MAFDSKVGDYADNKVGLNALKLVCSGGTEMTSEEKNVGSWQGNSSPCTGGYTKAKAHVQEQRVDPSSVLGD